MKSKQRYFFSGGKLLHGFHWKEAAEMTLQTRLPQMGEGIVTTRRSPVQIWPTHPHVHTQMQSTGAKALSSTCPRLCQSKGWGSVSSAWELDWPRSPGHAARTLLLLQPLGFILLSALSLNHLVLHRARRLLFTSRSAALIHAIKKKLVLKKNQKY